MRIIEQNGRGFNSEEELRDNNLPASSSTVGLHFTAALVADPIIKLFTG